MQKCTYKTDASVSASDHKLITIACQFKQPWKPDILKIMKDLFSLRAVKVLTKLCRDFRTIHISQNQDQLKLHIIVIPPWLDHVFALFVCLCV